jgi:hypothetical protein
MLQKHYTDKWITQPFWCIRNGRDVYELLTKDGYDNTQHWHPKDDISFREMGNLEYLEWLSR